MTQNGFEVEVTNVHKAKDMMKLGDHWGNKFEIILRLLETHPESILVENFDKILK